MTIVEDIESTEAGAAIVYETDAIIAFMDQDPIPIGRVLVCPKKPYHDFLELPAAVLEDLMLVGRIIYKKFAPCKHLTGLA